MGVLEIIEDMQKKLPLENVVRSLNKNGRREIKVTGERFIVTTVRKEGYLRVIRVVDLNDGKIFFGRYFQKYEKVT